MDMKSVKLHRPAIKLSLTSDNGPGVQLADLLRNRGAEV